MDSQKFISICDELVRAYTEKHCDKTDNIPDFEVYVVWSCKTLKNNKALLSTSLPDGMYYEITYNGEKDEFCFDAYKKFENLCVKYGKV